MFNFFNSHPFPIFYFRSIYFRFVVKISYPILFEPILKDRIWGGEKLHTVLGKQKLCNSIGESWEVSNVPENVSIVANGAYKNSSLDDLIKAEVEDFLDHKNLNLDVPEFSELIPTAENIAIVIWKKLRLFIDKNKDLEVVLYETNRNYVSFKGEGI